MRFISQELRAQYDSNYAVNIHTLGSYQHWKTETVWMR